MTNGFGLIIEILVAVLLGLTIAYCMMLNRRLKLLRSDEHSLRATISELVTATEIAERAIAGLKVTVEECELGLGARLRSADRFTADLDRSIAAGKDLLDRLSQIVAAGGGSVGGKAPPAKGATEKVAQGQSASPPPPRKDAQAVAAAAAAFAERVRMKVHGLAA
ncbi:MAG: DUF6468 domain-containing protein [Xanthobacteraceae bacterium]